MKYIVRYRSLKKYINMGLKITKIHWMLQFYQTPWMNGYIDSNTITRKQAVNDFDKENFKLMKNSLSGKQTENIRKHIDFK